MRNILDQSCTVATLNVLQIKVCFLQHSDVCFLKIAIFFILLMGKWLPLIFSAQSQCVTDDFGRI